MDGIFVPVSDDLQMSNLEYYLLAILTFVSDFQASLFNLENKDFRNNLSL